MDEAKWKDLLDEQTRIADRFRKEWLEVKGAVEFYRSACVRTNHEVEQVLGKALGYPPLYPDASEVDDGTVGVGDHTAASLADEAAEEIARLVEVARDAITRLRLLARDTDSWAPDGIADDLRAAIARWEPR